MHEATLAAGHQTRRGVRVVTAMPLASRQLGVSGIADLVELHKNGKKWQPYPVEYKRGRPKAHRADEVQLCAQAICLEEMFKTRISEGALFYGKTRRRVAIAIDDELRALTCAIADEARTMICNGKTPAPVYAKKKCSACSLFELCRPKRLQRQGSVNAWLHRRVEEV